MNNATERQAQHKIYRSAPKSLAFHMSYYSHCTASHAANKKPQNFRKMFEGIRHYQCHPYTRQISPLESVYKKGEMQVLKAPGNGRSGSGDTYPVPVLFIPSLINPSTIMDLHPRRSLLRWFADNKFGSYLVDWGCPQNDGNLYSLNDIIVERLIPAIEEVLRIHNSDRIHLAGYCMGGLLSIAASDLLRGKVASLQLLSSPWNFWINHDHLSRIVIGNLDFLKTSLAQMASVPSIYIQSLFAFIDPYSLVNRFSDFVEMKVDSFGAELFIAAEEWANGGVNLPAELALDCLEKMYEKNLPCSGKWYVGDQNINLQNLNDLPVQIIHPSKDKVVPLESTKELCKHLHNVNILKPQTGHVGIICGRNAIRDIWTPMIEFAIRNTS